MYLCYIDESGTPEVPGVSSHFVLAGVSIPVWHWRGADRDVTNILVRYGLAEAELHTGWMLHSYYEQGQIPHFASLDWATRRAEVNRKRAAYLLHLQRAGKPSTLRRTKKNYRHTAAYVHLTRSERLDCIRDVADCIGGWGFARLFAECIDKLHFDSAHAGKSVEVQAFEQVVTRFERLLSNIDPQVHEQRLLSLLIHDNNQSVAKKHTDLMREFHRVGTPYGNLEHIIETPLFVDSALTRMIQISDLCAYSLRRYVENKEKDLFGRIFPRADRIGSVVVGVRHYTTFNCACDICLAHRPKPAITPIAAP
jgi:Protein of unknown function (DUF3800)